MVVKAFELVEVIGNVSVLGDNFQTKIECIECCGKEMFIGTTEGGIIVFSLEESQDPNGEITYSNKRECHRLLDSRKPVINIKTASALNRLLVLCDGTIHLLDMNGLNNAGVPIRGITTFCVNENPNVANPFCIQICCALAGKRQLRVLDITNEQVVHVKDVPIFEPAVSLVLDGGNICAALQSQYAIYNFLDGTTQTLFTFDQSTLTPIMRRITKDEFLVNAPEGLGMFVSVDGSSRRPPLQWVGTPSALAYVHPYVLSVTAHAVVVHSIVDQRLVQTMPFTAAHAVGNFDGTILGVSRSAVFRIVPVAWEQQVQAALDEGRVDQAMELVDNVSCPGPGPAALRLEATRRRLTQAAGFVALAGADWASAQALLARGAVDPCEIISLFPGLLPSSSSFARSAPPLHRIADVNQLFARDQAQLAHANAFLKQLLTELRHTAPVQHRREEVDTALVKLCAQESPDALAELIAQGEVRCQLSDCTRWLQDVGAHHALALLHRQQGANDRALAIWCLLVEGQLTDTSFPGLPFLVDFLASLTDEVLVWKYAQFVLANDEDAGAGLFTREMALPLEPDAVSSFLQPFPRAATAHLEHLVLNKEIPSEKFHTRLAMLYMEDVTRLIADRDVQENPEDQANLDDRANQNDQANPDDWPSQDDRADRVDEALRAARHKFQALLRQSNLYRVQLLLSRVQEAQLHQETAVLLGKLGKHEAALDILVHKLKDFPAAEDYCTGMSLAGSEGSDHAFQLLLKTYLNPNLLVSERSEYLVPALRLLETRAAQLNPTKVLELIPAEWNVAVVESFVRAALRGSLVKYRTSKMAASLARGENLQQKCLLQVLQRHSVPLYTTNYCCVCKQPFPEPSFARFPNDVLVHPECVRHSHICPITGRNFLPVGAKRSRR